MELGLANKKILVTGGTRGIGRAIALRLAQEKAHVLVIGRSPVSIKEVFKEMGGAAKGHASIACDLTKNGGPAKAIKIAIKEFGNPDIIINNIGDTLGITNHYCSLKDWHRAFRINFEIAVEFNQLCVPYMKRQGWGRIVHIASTASMENSGPVTYCVPKAALAEYSAHIGRELAPDGIVVSAIMPGAIIAKGSYWDRTLLSKPDHVKHYIDERLPLGRFGTPEEISSVVAFLCSQKAGYLFGNNVGIDGSQSKHFFGLY